MFDHTESQIHFNNFKGISPAVYVVSEELLVATRSSKIRAGVLFQDIYVFKNEG